MIMKHIPRPLTALLVAMLSLAIAGSDLMAAKKDKDGDKGSSRGKGKKEQVQRGGGGDRGSRVAHSRPSAPKPQHHVASRSSSKSKAKPSSSHRDTTRLAVQRSSSKPRVDSKKRSDDIARHQLASSSAASRARAAESKSKSIDRSAALARSRDHDKNKDRARVASRDNDRDRARIAASRDVNRSRTDVRKQIDSRHLSAATATRSIDRNRDGDRDRHRHSDRDRSHYTVRRDHDHHSYDWYSSNGYDYDYDYYRTYHRHRYYNDALGVFLFALTAPPAYVYDSTPAYYNGYGYETRMAVQEELARAGYYDGDIDGVVGPGTRSAIYAYQQDYGLYATGRIDDQLLQSLGLTNY
jgi:hypothetical protein